MVAGGFKRAEPDLKEEELLMRALRDFNIPKIVQEDSAIFFGLLGDLFPGASLLTLTLTLLTLTLLTLTLLTLTLLTLTLALTLHS